MRILTQISLEELPDSEFQLFCAVWMDGWGYTNPRRQINEGARQLATQTRCLVYVEY